jgi:hypothetical protein
MKPFKFLQANDDVEIEPYDGASWMFGRIENLNQYQYNILTENHYGIHSFLNQFPDWFIITVLSITGPNGFEHNADNEGTGWGFDITSDLIRVEWVRFIN